MSAAPWPWGAHWKGGRELAEAQGRASGSLLIESTESMKRNKHMPAKQLEPRRQKGRRKEREHV